MVFVKHQETADITLLFGAEVTSCFMPQERPVGHTLLVPGHLDAKADSQDHVSTGYRRKVQGSKWLWFTKSFRNNPSFLSSTSKTLKPRPNLWEAQRRRSESAFLSQGFL